MGIVEVFFAFSPAAKNIFQFACCIIMGDVLCTISISNVKIAIL